MDSRYRLAVKVPAVDIFGGHDSSAALFKEGKLLHAVEEERFNRIKHGGGEFPIRSIEYCLEEEGLEIENLESIIFTYDPSNYGTGFFRSLLSEVEQDGLRKFYRLKNRLEKSIISRGFKSKINLRQIETHFDGETPQIEYCSHHRCHAISAFHPSGFEDALVLTLDGRGEIESTVVWDANLEGLNKMSSFEYPNSLGTFYGAVTEFLGYRNNNGEGKVMGLAPYGSENEDIEDALRDIIELGPEYDVSALTSGGVEKGVERLEEIFDRERNEHGENFDQWEKDLAYIVQKLLEEMVKDLVRENIDKTDSKNVCLAGGVALNCKMNKAVMEMPEVDNVFVQPVCNDAGIVLGAGWKDQSPDDVEPMSDVYWGPSYSNEEVEEKLRKYKLDYSKPENLEREVAEEIADGKLIGWFQRSLEMGPRALGHRSILASPKTEKSRKRVNKYVKNRESWRPFAPSMLEEAADEYLEDAEESPYMIKTFDVKEEKKEEIPAALHPGDETTRPQTVSKEQDERYYGLIKEFEKITGTPVILNTSFNDHGEPIVNTPKQAIKDFYAMGLDVLVINDYIVRKQ